MGNVLQIDAELKNIVVRNEIDNSPFKIGDSLLKIENKSIDSFQDFISIVSILNNNESVNVLVKRDNSIFTLKCSKEILEKIRFNNLISGFATLTYINPVTNKFGAVGHPINIGNTKKIPIKSGYISCTNNLSIKKSSKGCVGCVSADKKFVIGDFHSNTNFGIKGNVSNLDLCSYKKYKVASLDEVKLGKAQIILQDTDNKCKKYNIEVVGIEKQRRPASKGIKIKIVDKELLRQTGGIVQGMSGTPIIQDDKIIGAISHALENNPAMGYAVHIKWMVEENS
ncbi:MAG: SpoIVB peptidase S55 domain-containing protein [Terrisporobacter sp.]|uniref:SpoIVB peptidase S55 domain-containing protein n=1 Tax=Terrisporobacter sp. TaxID=1965305 RepID=UPI002FC6AF93